MTTIKEGYKQSRYEDISALFVNLTDKFFKRLERKTGWGKEEIKAEFKEVLIEIAMEMLSTLSIGEDNDIPL